MTNERRPGEGKGESEVDGLEPGSDDRRLRWTFDQAAARYHRARPRYPAGLCRSLLEVTGLEPGARVVEVGPASGVASEQLADLGLALTCVELGSELAAEAARNLARFPTVEVVNQDFESWVDALPANGERSYDAVVAATAWHWLDPETAYDQAYRVLQPGGWLAFWSALHVFPDDGDPIFKTFQAVYDRLGFGTADDWHFPRPGELPVIELPVSASFEMVSVRHFDWELIYDADQYIDLLMTFSGHIAMPTGARSELFSEIRGLVDQRADGLLRRHWGAVLHIAKAR